MATASVKIRTSPYMSPLPQDGSTDWCCGIFLASQIPPPFLSVERDVHPTLYECVEGAQWYG